MDPNSSYKKKKCFLFSIISDSQPLRTFGSFPPFTLSGTAKLQPIRRETISSGGGSDVRWGMNQSKVWGVTPGSWMMSARSEALQVKSSKPHYSFHTGPLGQISLTTQVRVHACVYCTLICGKSELGVAVLVRACVCLCLGLPGANWV